MDKTDLRLLEIAGHLDAIAEQMKADSQIPVKIILNSFHAEEIKELADEIKGLIEPTANSN